MVESGTSIDGKLVIANGFKFVIAEDLKNIVPNKRVIHIDYMENSYNKGFIISLIEEWELENQKIEM